MNTVLCPGTYDPVTVGHLDTIARCASMFDKVVVGVVDDSTRKRVLFTTDERIRFLEESTEHLPNVTVAKITGLVVDLARDVGAHVLVKGRTALIQVGELHSLSDAERPRILLFLVGN